MDKLFRCIRKRKKSEETKGEETNDSPVSICQCKCKCYKQYESKGVKKSFVSDSKDGDRSDGNNSSSKSTRQQLLSTVNGSPITSTMATRTNTNGQIEYGTNNMTIDYYPVSKDDPHYNMGHKRTGKALIFNFEKWNNTSLKDLNLKPRKGSEKDRDDLETCCKMIGFDVEVYNDLTNLEFWDVIEHTRMSDHRENDCLLVSVMTHGEKNTIYLSCGTQIPVNLIWESFEAHKCPTLAAKPKIFIMQACRGTQYDHGTAVSSPQKLKDLEMKTDVTDSGAFSYVIPNAADVVVAFSSPPGYYSWRSPEEGSWFIQAICKVFNEYAFSKDILELFTIVAREVAVNKESWTTDVDSNKKKQVASISSTLIRLCRFQQKSVRPLTTHRVPCSVYETRQNVIGEDELKISEILDKTKLITSETILVESNVIEDSIAQNGDSNHDNNIQEQ